MSSTVRQAGVGESPGRAPAVDAKLADQAPQPGGGGGALGIGWTLPAARLGELVGDVHEVHFEVVEENVLHGVRAADTDYREP